MAEEEEEEEEEGPKREAVEEVITNSSNGSSLRPAAIPPRSHKDSLREVSELEPINEQSEHLDSTSLEENENGNEKKLVD